MQSFRIGRNEAGQRFDKFLRKYLRQAGGGFLYRMLRKKNITLNGAKAEGGEILREGDLVSFFFSEETFSKFTGQNVRDGIFQGDAAEGVSENGVATYARALEQLAGITVAYEDEHVLIADKPAGVLSQKENADGPSLNEWLIGYLLASGQTDAQGLCTFRPSVCNRLDRNTSGLVLCGKTLPGSQELSRIIREHSMRKFYRTVVKGAVRENAHITGYMRKEAAGNRARVFDFPGEGTSFMETRYEPLRILDGRTYLEVELITGRTHQIRAHLSSAGHPLLGDYKYGDRAWNDACRKRWGITHQLLHAYRVEFPALCGPLEELSGRTVIAPLPELFAGCLEEG